MVCPHQSVVFHQMDMVYLAWRIVVLLKMWDKILCTIKLSRDLVLQMGSVGRAISNGKDWIWPVSILLMVFWGLACSITNLMKIGQTAWMRIINSAWLPIPIMLGQFCTGTTNADLVGIEIKLAEAYVPKAGLLGYDVIDGECSISIITNWGTDKENLINPHLISNGLIGGLA